MSGSGIAKEDTALEDGSDRNERAPAGGAVADQRRVARAPGRRAGRAADPAHADAVPAAADRRRRDRRPHPRAVSAALAWRQYRDDQHRAVSDLNARVVLVGAAGELVSRRRRLDSRRDVGGAVGVRIEAGADIRLLQAGLGSGGTIFTGGIGWVDRSGEVVASSSGGAGVGVADRVYFKPVTATRKPYISAGLIGRKLRQPIIVVAVPTRDAAGRLTGVLSGAIRLKTLGQSKQNAALGFEGLTIVDRDGHLLLAGLAHAANRDAARPDREARPGRLTNADGLRGGGHHVLAFATAKLPGWTIVIDRPASSVYASARRSLILEIVSLGAALLAVLLILFACSSSARAARSSAQGEQAQSWSKLHADARASPRRRPTSRMSSSSRVQSVFPDAVVVVTLDSEAGQETRATSRLPGWRRVAGDSIWLRTIAAPDHRAGPRPGRSSASVRSAISTSRSAGG